MKNRIFFIISIFLSSFSFIQPSTKLEKLTQQAISSNSNESKIAINELRAMKQTGLNALFDKYSAEIKQFESTGEQTETWKRIALAIDSVAMQKDSYASKLFWHTDLDEAKKTAKEQGKPILSLRLLGNLNEEFSCANSRFFRSILYPNANISNFLRENYILHWESVRPAPRITIDFGDGRKIERTVTGNSIHYVLNEDGTVIDAITGLNAPHTFLHFIQRSQEVSKNYDENKKLKPNQVGNIKVPETNRTVLYQDYTREIYEISNKLKLKFDTQQKPLRNFEEMPPALLAANLAITKSVTEVGVLKSFTADVTKFGDDQINFEQWKQIAKLTNTEPIFDANSIAFIKRQTKLSDADFAKLIENLKMYVAIDTARNNFLMRPSILVWLNKDGDKDVEKLNNRVYSDLFLTPNNDKWLGLYSTDLYTALDGNGIIQ